jgi:hypothetical protein
VARRDVAAVSHRAAIGLALGLALGLAIELAGMSIADADVDAVADVDAELAPAEPELEVAPAADRRAVPGTPVVGPPIGEVIAAASTAAGLDHDPTRSFARRARLSGLVPWVAVRTGNTASWHDTDPDVGRGTTIEVRATWRLDRLAFDSRELAAASLGAARRRERRALASQVIQAYFSWCRANMARSRTRAAEAAAELDAVTEGWFSRRVTAARRTASEPRTPCPAP